MTFRPRSESEMSNYSLADRSNITVSSLSTLGFETLARGNRTLITGAIISRALQGAGFHNEIWVANTQLQPEFDEALDALLLTKDETFRISALQSMAYFTGSDLGDFGMDNLHEAARTSLARRARDI